MAGHTGLLKWYPPYLLESAIYDRLSDRHKYFVDDAMRGLPVVGSWLRAGDNTRNMDAYLRNYGLSWSDIKNHNVNLGYGMAVRDTIGSVSKNVTSLYRSSRRRNGYRRW